jgi:hypothetical protein
MTRPARALGASNVAAIAGSIGAVLACCTVEVLVAAGVLAGIGGASKGGIAVAAGLAVAVTAWLTALILRRRQAAAAEDCCPPAGTTGRIEPANPATVGER